MIANVRAEWSDGNLVFKDLSGNTLLTINSSTGLVGNVTGNVTGNLTGDVTGAVSGGTVNPSISFTAGTNVVPGNLLYISGWDAVNSRYAMNKADADASAPANKALFICSTTSAQGAVGTAVGAYTLTAQNTDSASAVGDPVYLSTTAGGWTLSAPSGNGQTVQQVGVVAVKSATVGEIRFFPFYSKGTSVST